jgi:hypothetical protein
MPKEKNANGGAVARVPRQAERRHARAEIAALRNRVDANWVRIEEVVLLINELREQMEARFARVHETMANLQVLLAAIGARK